MKCELIRDLLPLYIDGLTSEESNKEIEKHLKSCKDCKNYFQEMTGEIIEAAPVTEEEIQDAKLIKKIKKKKRHKFIAVCLGAAAVLALVVALTIPRVYGVVKYEDVSMEYGIKGNKAYMKLAAKPGYRLAVSGSTGGDDSQLKIFSNVNVFDHSDGIMGWEDDLGTKSNPCKWTLEFKDRILYFENGELLRETKK